MIDGQDYRALDRQKEKQRQHERIEGHDSREGSRQKQRQRQYDSIGGQDNKEDRLKKRRRQHIRKQQQVRRQAEGETEVICKDRRTGRQRRQVEEKT